MFGLEAIWRNGQVVGHIRRADFGFAIDKTLAYGYIRDPSGGPVSQAPRPKGSPVPLETPHPCAACTPTPSWAGGWGWCAESLLMGPCLWAGSGTVSVFSV